MITATVMLLHGLAAQAWAGSRTVNFVGIATSHYTRMTTQEEPYSGLWGMSVFCDVVITNASETKQRIDIASVMFLNAGPDGGNLNFQKDHYKCCNYNSGTGVPGSTGTQQVASVFNAASAGGYGEPAGLSIPGSTQATKVEGLVLEAAGSSNANTIRITSHGTFNTRNMDFNQERRMICAGSISVSDVGTQPGAVVASGVIEHLANHTFDKRKMYGVGCPGAWNNGNYSGSHPTVDAGNFGAGAIAAATHLNTAAGDALREINRAEYYPIWDWGEGPYEAYYPNAQAGVWIESPEASVMYGPFIYWNSDTSGNEKIYWTFPLRNNPCDPTISSTTTGNGCCLWKWSRSTPTAWAFTYDQPGVSLTVGNAFESKCSYGPARLGAFTPDTGDDVPLDSIRGAEPEFPQRTPSGSSISGSRDFADYPQRMMRSYPQKIDASPFLINGGRPF